MHHRLLTTSVAALCLLVTACGSDDDSESTATDAPAAAATDAAPAGTDAAAPTDAPAGTDAPMADGPTITIGAQDFGESAILAQIYGQALEHAGYPVEQQALGGYRDIVYSSFEGGEIDFTAEYAASALEFLNGFAGEASSDVDATVTALRAQLEAKGLVALDASPAVDSNSFVVTPETASERGLTNVSDLTDDLTLGGPPDCTENASCIPGLIEVYGLDLSANFVPLDGGGPLTVTALESGEIDVAILFSTDGVIADKGWTVLEDDQGLINADNIVPVLTKEVADAYGSALSDLVDAISAALDTAELTELNRRFGIDAEDADDIARDWLQGEGFLD